MSCNPLEPTFAILLGSNDKIIIPTITSQSGFTENINFKIKLPRIKLTSTDIIQAAPIKIPLQKINGACESYIEPSTDFINDNKGGLPFIPLCPANPLINCKVCKKILGKKYCVSAPVCPTMKYIAQPYWENIKFNIPETTLIDFNYPEIEFNMDIHMSVNLELSGYIDTLYTTVYNFINRAINNPDRPINYGGFWAIITQVVAMMMADFKPSAAFPDVFVVFDNVKVGLKISVTNCFFKFGDKKIDIVNFTVDEQIIICDGTNRSMVLQLSAPNEISFNINLANIDGMRLVILQMLSNVAIIDAFLSLATIGGPLGMVFAYGVNEVIDAGFEELFKIPVFRWINDHIKVTITPYIKICPLTPFPILGCYGLTIEPTPLSEIDIKTINKAVSYTLDLVKNNLFIFKIGRDENNKSESVLQCLGFQKGKKFNDLIDDQLKSTVNQCNKQIEDVIDYIISSNVDIVIYTSVCMKVV